MGGSVPEIPGVKVEHDLTSQYRYEVANLLGRRQISFPGAQPVRVAARHLAELQREDYYVCEKTDGIRCLMYMTRDDGNELVFLIDRKNDYYHVPNLHFPLETEETEFHVETIVDGELVNDTLPDGGVQMKYLVFDCLLLDGNSLMHRTLDKRLAYFREKVFFPYRSLYQKYPQEKQFLPFFVQFKHMELGYAIEKVFNEILPNLPHGNDGLIFTCRNSPYIPGTDEHILKWKSKSDNSVDFRMHLDIPVVEPDSESDDEDPYPDYTAMPRINLTAFGGENEDVSYSTLNLTSDVWDKMKARDEPLDERIVECALDEGGKWRFLRFRDDKKESNHISVVRNVIQSIQDGITKDDLIRKQGQIRDAWKRRQAVAEEQAKREHEARKVAAMTTQQRGSSGQVGDAAISSGGVKRKFEGSVQVNANGETT